MTSLITPSFVHHGTQIENYWVWLKLSSEVVFSFTTLWSNGTVACTVSVPIACDDHWVRVSDIDFFSCFPLHAPFQVLRQGDGSFYWNLLFIINFYMPGNKLTINIVITWNGWLFSYKFPPLERINNGEWPFDRRYDGKKAQSVGLCLKPSLPTRYKKHTFGPRRMQTRYCIVCTNYRPPDATRKEADNRGTPNWPKLMARPRTCGCMNK